MIDAIPKGLVQLSTLPRRSWLRRTVWHPMLQVGNVPYWVLAEAPEKFALPEERLETSPAFDVGVVRKVFRWGQQAGRVQFTGPCGSLHYHPTNLWTLP